MSITHYFQGIKVLSWHFPTEIVTECVSLIQRSVTVRSFHRYVSVCSTRLLSCGVNTPTGAEQTLMSGFCSNLTTASVSHSRRSDSPTELLPALLHSPCNKELNMAPGTPRLLTLELHNAAYSEQRAEHGSNLWRASRSERLTFI